MGGLGTHLCGAFPFLEGGENGRLFHTKGESEYTLRQNSPAINEQKGLRTQRNLRNLVQIFSLLTSEI